MGIPGWPAYYKTIGDAVEATDKYLAKVKTNKYSTKDLIELSRASHAVHEFALQALIDAEN